MVRLILVRHGESEGNRDRTFTQSPEVPLTIVGRQQAQAAATQILRNFAARRVISSPFARARQTAELIATALGLEVRLEPDLCEQSFGVFAGQPYESLLNDAAYHEGPRWAWRPPGGESLLDVAQRAVPAVQRIVAAAQDEDIVVVSHGGVMLALCAHVAGTWDGLNVTPNCGIVVVEVVDGKWVRRQD
jgi:probable phosphoglycerate mutase